MRNACLPGAFMLLISLFSCRDNPATERTSDGSTVTRSATLPPDVIATTKPLIRGRLYKEASLEEGSVVNFDTSQQILVIDTTDALFIKARIVKDTTTFSGYVLKAILPE